MHIPITKPYITEREHELVHEALSSGWLVQGPKVKEFERQVASFAGARYAVAVNSCTSGQMLLSHILGIGAGDEVPVPAFTWISTANAVEYRGARPVFCDINLDTFNVDAEQLRAKVNDSTRALYPVSLFGLSANMPAIQSLADQHRLPVVEDVACGLGSFINDQHCGTFGLAGILSFHPRKSITTGEGGVIITNDEGVAQDARSLREHGAVKSDHDRHTSASSHQMSAYPRLGFNMRMTDLQAALGIAQVEKLDEILRIKNQLAQEYRQNLGDISWLRLPEVPPGYTHSYQTYCTLFKPQEAYDALEKKDVAKLDELHDQRNALMEALAQKGIMTRPGTHALHIQQLYQQKYGYHKMDFPNAYAADRLSLALPFYPTITREEKDYLFTQIRKINPSCAE
jgi:dTDP-4-amino-4,6-dideoxygalactose transaminase